MGGVFGGSKPPPPKEDDTLKKQLAIQEEDRDKSERRNDARLRNLRRRGNRRPLLFQGFQGVEAKSETLG